MNQSKNVPKRYPKDTKILLMLAPFWAPLTPPLNSSCLKSYLKQHGYCNVKTVDANILSKLWEMNRKYLAVLKKAIPEDKRGNFNMVGYDVFMNHLMAHINQTHIEEYFNLVKLLVSKNFFVDIGEGQIMELNEVLKEFYLKFEEYLDGLIEKEKPSVVGITVYSLTLAPSLFAFKFIKEKHPKIETVMGGGVFADQLNTDSPNFKVFLEKAPYVDKIVLGEGEHLFLKLLEGELPEEQRVYSRKDICDEEVNLSLVNVPDYSDIDVEKYMELAAYAGRSCPFQCTFCSETVQWGKYRKKETKQIVDELVALQKKHQNSLFLFGDSLINPVIRDLAEEIIQRNTNIYWDAYLRIDNSVCNPINALTWKRGGFYRARLGIESGSQHVLDLMNKRVTIQQIKNGLVNLAKVGIKTTTYWVIGHPGETEEDFQETLDMLEECKEDIYEADPHPFYFFPTGQVNSDNWTKDNRISLLYPEEATDMLITQTWTLDTEPNRKEIYDRLCRFNEHCKKLGIPNPYSLWDVLLADKRWKDLHKNSVPSIREIREIKTQ